MRIGFIEDTHLHGGTQIWVAEAVDAFLEQNQDVSILAPQGSWIIEQCQHTNAAIFSYDWDEVVHKSPHAQEIWINALKDCDVAICTVHPPRDDFHCAIFAAFCIKKGGLKTHLIPKTGTIVPNYRREFYMPDETLQSSVIAIADFTRKYLVETYKIPADKVALIYQGTDIERFRHSENAWNESQNRYLLPHDASPILGAIGSFEKRKGHSILFEALKELVSDDLPNAHLMVVGDGPDEMMLKEKVRTLGLEANVSFFPFTDNPALVFERVDMTILPSLYKEGLPNVLLESMSMGVPVVSSNIGGVSEIVFDGETGYIVQPGNKSALANAIKTLWADQDAYQEMKIKTRKLITENFNKETQFSKFISYFQSQLLSRENKINPNKH